jgi:hypothetical protein
MTDSHSAKGKAAKWLPALIAALVLVALAAWWFNRNQDVAEDSASMAADPTSQLDASGAQTGQPAVPEGTNAAALAGRRPRQRLGDRERRPVGDRARSRRRSPDDGSRRSWPGAAPRPVARRHPGARRDDTQPPAGQ